MHLPKLYAPGVSSRSQACTCTLERCSSRSCSAGCLRTIFFQVTESMHRSRIPPIHVCGLHHEQRQLLSPVHHYVAWRAMNSRTLVPAFLVSVVVCFSHRHSAKGLFPIDFETSRGKTWCFRCQHARNVLFCTSRLFSGQPMDDLRCS